MRKFKLLLVQHKVPLDNVRITGTSAPRIAENGEVFQQLVRDIIGKELELIDGRAKPSSVSGARADR